MGSKQPPNHSFVEAHIGVCIIIPVPNICLTRGCMGCMGVEHGVSAWRERMAWAHGLRAWGEGMGHLPDTGSGVNPDSDHYRLVVMGHQHLGSWGVMVKKYAK